jgi:quinohemoprotein ethanol dehydrogenase
MASSPQTGLVYLPAQSLPAVYGTEAEFKFDPGYWNPGVDYETLESPDDPAMIAEINKLISGELLAWDPVAQKEIWRYQHAGPWNGGVLATAGDLVFQGSLIGGFAAYNARSGERLWVFDAQTGVAAAPISYGINGEQHVAVAAGWGTVFALLGGNATAAMGMHNKSRILAFKRGGDVALPAREMLAAEPIPEPPARIDDASAAAMGKDLYYERCVMCHGIDVASGGLTPDLRRSSAETHATWDAIVLGGSQRNNGMPAFGGILGKDQSDAIRAFVISQAWRAYDRQSAAGGQ